MFHRGIIGNRKRKLQGDKSDDWAYDCPVIPGIRLTIEDMPEFKKRLHKAIATDQVFMTYNNKKYSREYAKLAIRVTENALLTKVIHDP